MIFLKCVSFAQVIYIDAMGYFPEEVDKIMEIIEEKLLRTRTSLQEIRLLQAYIERTSKPEPV